MNNIIEYKDWLFVAIPDELGDFQMSYMQADNDLILVKPDTSLKWITTLPGGLKCWQIIGKGDQLSESDWEGLLTKEERQNIVLNSFLLLKTFGMELENCLVLKKSKS